MKHLSWPKWIAAFLVADIAWALTNVTLLHIPSWMGVFVGAAFVLLVPTPWFQPEEPEFRVYPSFTGCICGMPNAFGTIYGGDCRSIGCDPKCPRCGGENDD